MARNVRTARGEIVDFDALILKQKIAQAPMSIEVARRKEFIDNKEGRGRGQRSAPEPTGTVVDEVVIDPVVDVAPPIVEATPVSAKKKSTSASDFETDNVPPDGKK